MDQREDRGDRGDAEPLAAPFVTPLRGTGGRPSSTPPSRQAASRSAAEVDTEFAIAVSPAISWQRQGRYDLDTSLAAQDATPAELAATHRHGDAQRELMARGAACDEHLDLDQQLPAALERFDAFGRMGRNRGRLASLSTEADAARSLSDLRGTPALLQLGGHDVRVDVEDTQRVHRRMLGPESLDVARPPTPTTPWCAPTSSADGVLADIERSTEDPRC